MQTNTFVYIQEDTSITDYTKSTNFTSKDALPPGDSGKIIRGSEFDTEFTAVQTAVNSKANKASPTFTGTTTVAGLTVSGTFTLGATALTATGAELNILDGVTATAAELNILDGVTATAAELNILDGVTATAAEINYVDGVTSNVQTQLDAITTSLDGLTFDVLTQAAYDALTPDANTIYFVTS